MYIILNKEWYLKSHSNTKISIKNHNTLNLSLSSENMDKLKNWCKYINWEIIETEEYIEKIKEEKKALAYKEFKETLAPITSQYTQEEIASFPQQETEAKMFLETWKSEFIEWLVKEWETAEELANKIIANSEAYKKLFVPAYKKLRTTLENINS